MVQITATIITYNEGKNIGRCIDSLTAIADEIVVVDSISDDNTKKICLEKGVRFIEHPFKGHIEQKNYAIDQAKNNIILSLDADEALSEQMKQSLAEVKNNWQHDAYSFNRLTNYCGKWIKHCGWYPDIKVRLWDRRKGRWGGVNPHDEVIMEKAATCRHLNGDILHYSYYTIWQHIDQVNKFTEIGAKQAHLRGKKSGLLKILVKPVWKFFRDFVVKRGILDGYYGFVISAISAHATFVKYIKMKELQKND